jgi:hypothetical protein
MGGFYTPLPFVCQLPRSVLASRVLPLAGVCAGGRRVFRHLYTRHANTRKPVAVALSAVAYKRVGSGLQMCTFWLTACVILGLHRARFLPPDAR